MGQSRTCRGGITRPEHACDTLTATLFMKHYSRIHTEHLLVGASVCVTLADVLLAVSLNTYLQCKVEGRQTT